MPRAIKALAGGDIIAEQLDRTFSLSIDMDRRRSCTLSRSVHNICLRRIMFYYSWSTGLGMEVLREQSVGKSTGPCVIPRPPHPRSDPRGRTPSLIPTQRCVICGHRCTVDGGGRCYPWCFAVSLWVRGRRGRFLWPLQKETMTKRSRSPVGHCYWWPPRPQIAAGKRSSRGAFNGCFRKRSASVLSKRLRCTIEVAPVEWTPRIEQ